MHDTRRHIATRQHPVYGEELLQSACFPPEQLLADSSFIRRGCLMKFTKPATTYEDQADILFERGLALRENSADNSREEIILRLRYVGYYRLSGYWYPFMRDGKFTEGVTFAMIWRRYTFDRQLRFHVLDAIERVEIFYSGFVGHGAGTAIRTVRIPISAERTGYERQCACAIPGEMPQGFP